MGPKKNSATPAAVSSTPPSEMKIKLSELLDLKEFGLIDERTWLAKVALVMGVDAPPQPSSTAVTPCPQPAGADVSLEDSSTAAERKLASLARNLIGSSEEPVIRGVLWQALMGAAVE